MPVEEEQTPQEQIMQGIWRIALQTVVVLVCIAFGIFIGYTLWGDAPELKDKVVALTDQVQTLKNEREAQNARTAMCERDKADFKKRLDKTFDRNNELQQEVTDLKKQLGG
jgi:cell division protein FtsB